MPWPAQITTGEGTLRIGVDFSIAIAGAGGGDARIKAAVQRTMARLARQTGLPLPAESPLAGRVILNIAVEKRDHGAPQKLGDEESYALVISPDRIRLSADGPLGSACGGWKRFCNW